MDKKTLNYLRKSGVKIKLADEQIHVLKYDMNALEYLEGVYGGIKNLDSVELTRAKDIKHFIKAGLLHEYPEGEEPSLREIGALMDMDMIMNFENYIGEALELSMPYDVEGDSPKK